MNVTNINFYDIRLNSKEYLKQFMIKWDRNIWEVDKENIEEKKELLFTILLY